MSNRQENSVLRVILVGHSPLEAQLRKDPGIELVRSRSSLDAIGELSLSDVVGDAPSVVVFSGPAAAEVDTADSIRAMRRVNDTARFIAIRARGDSVDDSTAPFDAWIDEDTDITALRDQLLSEAPSALGAPRAPGSPNGSRHFAPPIEAASTLPLEPSDTHVSVSDPLVSDEGVLGTLLTGGEILTPCMDQLRRTFHPNEIDFQWAPAGDSNPPAGAQWLPVTHRDRLFGWLRGPAEHDRRLAHATQWLGSWLAVREQHAQLRSAAFTDPLTGAWNRRYLDRFLPVAIDRARQMRHDVTLLLFDIDNFKHYNDTYGHPAGDEILIETVRLLNSVIRPTDRVTRIGGDEFAVVFDDPEGPRDPRSHHPASIFQIAKRFQRQINDHRFPKLGECARGALTISGGLATFPWDASDAAALIERADRLILDSKRSGKNVICIGAGAQQALGGCGDIGGRLCPDVD